MTAATVVVDASVCSKWTVEDRFSTQARSTLARYRFMAPWLILAETANTLWKYVRVNVITDQQAAEALAALPRVVSLEADPLIARRAVLLAAQFDHPAYDCFYLALAERENLSLLTFDQDLASMARELNLSVAAFD